MMSRWAFRFLLWYICIILVQPQNRFPFLWPLHIADISFLGMVGFHALAVTQENKPAIRLGLGTQMGFLLLAAGLISQYIGIYQINTDWNGFIDSLVKNTLVLIMVETMASTVERVWAVMFVYFVASLWWVKAGLRLSSAGATYAGDRLMGPAVSLVENPNGFAYMMCLLIPTYLFFYQQTRNRYLKYGMLVIALCAVYIILETGSRTGMMILIALGFFLLPKYFSQYKTTIVTIVAALFFIFTLVSGMNVERFKSIPKSMKAFLYGEEIKPTEELSQDEQSAQERRLKNRDTWALIKEHPIFGVGMNPHPSLMGRFPMAIGQVHCEILMAGREMGIIGMGLYSGMLLMLFIYGGKIQKHTAGWWPMVSDLGWTLKLQALVIMVGGAFSPLPWNPPMMILVGVASALWTNLQAQSYTQPWPAAADAQIA